MNAPEPLVLAEGAPELLGAGVASPVGPAVLLVLLLVFFLSLRGFFAGSETALVSLNQLRIRRLAEGGDRRARIVRALIDDPERMLAITLVGTNLMSVIIAQVSLALMILLLGTTETTTLVATGTTTVLVLIFGEIIPKTIFRFGADTLALRYAYLLRFFELVIGLVANMVGAVTAALVRMLGQGGPSASREAVRAELRLMATVGEKSGGIPSDQRRMIHSVLDLRDRTVERVMVPLVDIVAVERGTTIERFLEVASESGLSRIPVYDGQIYDIVGIVHILDVIHSDRTSGTIDAFLREDVLYVPKSKNINVLLKEIQRSPFTMAFAVDEYGGIVGLATIEDIVEEIFGELSDEREERPDIRRISTRLLECDGRTEIDTLVDALEVPIPAGDYETIAGFILSQLGTIPKPGDGVETDHLVITVSDADERTILKVRIEQKSTDLPGLGET